MSDQYLINNPFVTRVLYLANHLFLLSGSSRVPYEEYGKIVHYFYEPVTSMINRNLVFTLWKVFVPGDMAPSVRFFFSLYEYGQPVLVDKDSRFKAIHNEHFGSTAWQECYFCDIHSLDLFIRTLILLSTK